MSQAEQFGLRHAEARREMAVVAQAVQRWQDAFRAEGVPDRDIDELARQIERPALKSERDAASRF